MKIKELYLKNFRCFEELTINFPTDYTVFIGNNGAGKSSILNALQTAMYSFVNATKMNKSKDKKIKNSDIRIKMVHSGSILNPEIQYPLIIGVKAKIDNENEIYWKRELKENALESDTGTKDVLKYANNLQKKNKK